MADTEMDTVNKVRLLKDDDLAIEDIIISFLVGEQCDYDSETDAVVTALNIIQRDDDYFTAVFENMLTST